MFLTCRSNDGVPWKLEARVAPAKGIFLRNTRIRYGLLNRHGISETKRETDLPFILLVTMCKRHLSLNLSGIGLSGVN